MLYDTQTLNLYTGILHYPFVRNMLFHLVYEYDGSSKTPLDLLERSTVIQ